MTHNLLPSYRTKKQWILELLSENKYTNPQIARIARTTSAYVAKIKSEANSGVSLHRESINLDTLPEPMQKHLPGIDRLGLILTTDDAENRKELWTQFGAKKSLDQIIQATGYHPQVVESEYKLFLKFRNCDMYELHKTMIGIFANERALIEANPEIAKKYRALVGSFNSKGYFENNEVLDILALLSAVNLEFRKQEAKRYFEKWVHVACKVCGKSVGVQMDGSAVTDEMVTKTIKAITHSACARASQKSGSNSEE